MTALRVISRGIATIVGSEIGPQTKISGKVDIDAVQTAYQPIDSRKWNFLKNGSFTGKNNMAKSVFTVSLFKLSRKLAAS